MTFIRKHKIVIVLSAVFILVLLLTVIYLKLFFTEDINYKYGKRIEGIENVKITDSMVNDIKSKILNDNQVNKITYRLDGRLIKFFIQIKKDVDEFDVENMLNVINKNFSDEEKSFYDLEVFITCEDKKEFYPMIAYKHRNNQKFTITKKEGSNDEK